MDPNILETLSEYGITGKCAVQYIVEANGDVFPCDFYVLDKYRMGSLLTAKPSELFEAAAPFLTDGREYAGQEPCLGCRYRNSCEAAASA